MDHCQIPRPPYLDWMRHLLVLLVCLLPGAAWGGSRHIQFSPPGSEVQFRAYQLGIVPLDGTFTRFTGSLTYDPDDHASCQVELRVDATSLATEERLMQDTVTGPDFLNVTQFPSLAYTGSCGQTGLQGNLDMRGVTHPFPLSLEWHDGKVEAEGRLQRAEWGMTALPGLAGRSIRIRVVVTLPAEHR
jgi:polyisoprenoid-binding protein YceI